MPNRRRIRLAVLLATCLTVTEGLWAQLQAGVVVEEVAKNFEGAKAGLAEGDVVLAWHRGDSKGEIASLFDFSLVEIEQAPRGTVTLEGLRGADKRSWLIGPDEWRLKTRPVLPDNLLSLYLDGEKLAKAGKLSEAADLWRSGAANARTSAAPWLGTWFLLHMAELFADVRQWDQADEAYQQAVQHAESSGAGVAAQILQRWGAAYERYDDFKHAEQRYRMAFAESQKLNPESLLTGAILSSLGRVIREQGNLIEAKDLCHQALAIQQRLAPGSLPVAYTFTILALIDYQGNLSEAVAYDQQALAIQQRFAPGSLTVARTLFLLGVVAYLRGDLTIAQDYYGQALALQQKLAPDSRDVVITLNNIGNFYLVQGELAKAESSYRSALTIRERLALSDRGLSSLLNNLGIIAKNRGDLARAEEYFGKALAIIRKRSVADPYMTTAILIGLGDTALQQGNDIRAEQCFHEALEVATRFSPDDPDNALLLDGLGSVYKDRKDWIRAEEYFSRALKLREKELPDSLALAESFQNLGDLAHHRGALADAERYHRRALAIRERDVPGSQRHAESLVALAGVMCRKQEPGAAGKFYEQALTALESQISRLGGGEDLRSQFRAKRSAYYKDYIDLLVSQRKTDAAFQVLERLHARSLLEILAAAHIDIRQGVDPSLLEQERGLQQSFSLKSNRRVHLLGEKHTDEQLVALDTEIKDILEKYRDVEEQVRAASPAYASLTQPQPLSAKEVQQQLVDPNTVLLEYSLGEDRSYVFAVTPTSLAAYELPKRAIIEHLARQVHSSLTAQNSRHKGETFLKWQARVTKAEAEYPKLAGQLSQMVLGPVSAQLKGKRLLIVSDGTLHYIPFAALPEPQPFSPGQTALPLMVRHEIVNLPSASVLSALRQGRAARTPAPKLVAVLADPVFDNQDARLRHTTAAERNASHGATRGQDAEAEEDDFAGRQLTRSAADIGLGEENGQVRFPRLQLTRREAQDILAVTPPGQGMQALDFNASRATALNPNLAQYRIVHFATHGLLDNQHPELSGLVLSLVNEQGKKQNGFLGLQDIYNMNLSADLVVLSACETGLGKQIEGEGLLSLTRGFMDAGAPRVVASLWKIDDLATASLMKEFYKAMEQQGERPAAALRQAQLAMWKTHRWSAPYYWAAFQVQGEWK